MEYDIKTEKGIMTVTLCGEMDHHSAKSVRKEIDTAIDLACPMILRLDLSSIAFCDSSGLGFIMGRYRKMAEIKGNMILVSPSKAAVKILQIAGLDKFIQIEVGAKL